jgi:hypothetical protein
MIVEVVGNAGVVLGHWAQMRRVLEGVLNWESGDVFGAGLGRWNGMTQGRGGARTGPSATRAAFAGGSLKGFRGFWVVGMAWLLVF